MITLTAALIARTPEQILQQLMADLATAGVDATGFDTYSVERALPELDAKALSVEENIRVQVVKGMVLEEAATLEDPAWLRRLAKSWYQVEWLPATKAVHTFKLTNETTGGPFTFGPRQLVATTADGILFRSVDGGTINAGVGQTLELLFSAEKAGIIGNIGAGQITKLVTGIPGVAIENEVGSLVAAGVEDETNQQLVDRSHARWSTLGAGGHSAAFLYLVRQAAPTVTRVFVRDDNPGGPGTVYLYLSNPAGPATAEELAAAIAYLAPLKPLGSGPVSLFASTPVIVNVAGTLYTDGTNAAALAEGQLALATLASGFIKPVLYLEVLRSRLMSVRGAINVVLSSPPGDTTILAHEVLQITTTGLAVA